MTNAEFARFVERHFGSVYAVNRDLGLARDTVDALMSGKTRLGKPYPVPAVVALACQAWAAGMRP